MNSNLVRYFINFLVLVVIVGGGVGLVAYMQKTDNGEQKQAAKGMPPALVTAVPIVEDWIQVKQMFVGTVLPSRTSEVGSAASGRVESFDIKEGDPVSAKQAIAQLRTGIVAAELKAAEADLETAKAELEKLRSSTPLEIDEAKAKLEMRESMAKFLVAKRARAFSDRGRQAYSIEEREQINALADEAQSSYKEARAILALLQEPRQKLILQYEGKVQSAAAEVERLAEQVARYTIRSPFNGYVTKEHTEAGEWLLQGALIAEIADLDRVYTEVPVLEDYVGFLKIGEPVTVEIPAVTTKSTFIGKIESIVPKGNSRSRTFPVKILIENEKIPNSNQVMIKAGMIGRVELPTSARKKGLLVPRDAINLDRDLREVYVVEDNRAKKVDVDLGLSQGDYVELIPKNSAELRPGMLVVYEGNERLFPGRELAVTVRKTKGLSASK